MEFKRYTSLENTYQQKLIDKIEYEGKSGGEWLVIEKVDGANFQFTYNGTELKTGSRNQWVDGTFYNCQSVINRYEDKIKMLWEDVVLGHTKDPSNTVITLYGELYGEGIMKRIKYGEKNFLAFDLLVNGTPQQYGTMLGLCKSAGLPVAHIKKVCLLKEALEYSPEFRSQYTPDDYEGENSAEGVVIRPIENKWFNNGGRIILKNKAPSFSEKKGGKDKGAKTVVELSQSDVNILETFCEYFTENRVHSVLSKLGEVGPKDFGKVLGLFVQDAYEDYYKDGNKDVKKEVGDYRKWVKSSQAEAAKVVRSVIFSKI